MEFGHLVKYNGKYYPAGAEVPVTTLKVELTDEVPEGALEINKNGSVNAYDENGNVVGTVSPEELENIQNEAVASYEEQEKTGKKTKK